jgi:TolB-like protein/Tfp pilus assembly protein PilF
MSFFDELKRRNVFKVAAAYIIIGWLIMQGGEVMAPALNLPDWVNSLLAFFLILGFPLAVFFAWAFEMTPEGIKKEKDVDRSQSITQVTGQKLNNAIIGLLVVALGYFVFDKFVLDPQRDAELVKASQSLSKPSENTAIDPAEDNGPDKKSIAVLPFVNMSSDPEQEYFSDGITEEVLNLLAKIPDLKVTSRSSVFSLKGHKFDITTLAKKLGVAHILEGSVRKSGNRVRITAQLIEADSDVHMWSDTYDRELDDIFAIQDEIAQEVVTVLQVQILGDIPIVRETDTSAYTAYLQGQHFLQLENPEGRSDAHDAFSKAIEIDPQYAPGWAGLGHTLRSQANWGDIEHNAGTESAREAVLQALKLDENLDEAWAALGQLQWVYDWDWVKAEGTIKTALQYGPNNVTALMIAANIAKTLGKYEKAIELGNRAVDVDPLNATILTDLGVIYWEAGQYELSAQTLERVLSLYPNHDVTRGRIAVVKVSQGKPEEALQFAQKENFESTRQWANAYIFHDLGREKEATRALDYLIENERNWMAYQIAGLYAYQGKPDKAFEWLEITYDQRDGGITHILGDPSFKSVHDDPRWEPYLLKLGLLDAWKDLQKRREEAQT